jgi:hypothetical protein
MPKTVRTPSPTASRAPSRIPLLVTTVGSCGIVALGWFLGAAPALDAAALSSAQVISTEALNITHRQTLVTLSEQHARIEEIRTAALALRLEVPAGEGMPDFVDQMSATAAAHGVTITEYIAEEPVAALEIAAATTAATTATAPAVEPAPASGPATAPTSDPATAPAAEMPTEPTVETPGTAGATTPSARLTATNLYAVPITLKVKGNPANARAALGDLQHGQRLFLVTFAEIVLAEQAEESVSEVHGYAYVLRD